MNREAISSRRWIRVGFAPATSLARRTRAPLSRQFSCLFRPRTGEHDGIDGGNHLPLDDFVLVDGDVADTRDILYVDVFKRSAQLLGRRNRLAIAVGDVEIDVFADPPGEAGAEHRIQAYRQFH